MITLSILAVSVPAAAASPFERVLAETQRIAAEQETKQRMVPNRRQAPRIGDRQAATRVKQLYVDHKILAVKLIETRGPPVYRVKTLSDEGVVKYVFVDGTSGDVFE